MIKSDNLPANSIAIVFTTTPEGEIDGSISWHFAEDLDEDIGQTMIDLAYGITATAQDSFEDLCELGAAVQENEEIIGDDTDLEGIDENLIVFQPSDYKQ
jgi:hypothetical protein